MQLALFILLAILLTGGILVLPQWPYAGWGYGPSTFFAAGVIFVALMIGWERE